MTAIAPELLERNKDRCRRCRAEILWASTGNGKHAPIDPEKVYGGNIELEVDDVGMLKVRHVKAAGDVEAYVSHFASCPEADHFRRNKTAANDNVPVDETPKDEATRRAEAFERVMPFGKFATEKLGDIVKSGRGRNYLKWAYGNMTFREPELKRAVGIVIGEET